jgi:hypothetical protein
MNIGLPEIANAFRVIANDRVVEGKFKELTCVQVQGALMSLCGHGFYRR